MERAEQLEGLWLEYQEDFLNSCSPRILASWISRLAVTT